MYVLRIKMVSPFYFFLQVLFDDVQKHQIKKLHVLKNSQFNLMKLCEHNKTKLNVL